MITNQHKFSFIKKVFAVLSDINSVMRNEFKTIFRDRGVVIIFVLASLVYPILYCGIYKNETLTEVPIAVVDDSHSNRSGEFLRKIDATPDVKIAAKYLNMDEAKKAYYDKKVHGIVYIPNDFNEKLNSREQATVAVYCDMSSFLYYRAMIQSTNFVTLDMGKEIQVERLNVRGIVGESAENVAEPVPFESNILFNPGAGFASFLMPAILILIIHQTLFFGIGMLVGTNREDNRFHDFVNSKLSHDGIYRVITGKSLSYFLLYVVFSFYILEVTPHLFNLPHIGAPIDLIKFILPFLFATIFFSMTVSVFFPERETGMIVFLFFSLILLFLSGISWPQSNMPVFWKTLSWIFPSTHGIQGYIKINSMGANITEVKYEYVSLWIQTGLYFITTTLAYRWQIYRSLKKVKVEN